MYDHTTVIMVDIAYPDEYYDAVSQEAANVLKSACLRFIKDAIDIVTHSDDNVTLARLTEASRNHATWLIDEINLTFADPSLNDIDLVIQRGLVREYKIYRAIHDDATALFEFADIIERWLTDAVIDIVNAINYCGITQADLDNVYAEDVNGSIRLTIEKENENGYKRQTNTNRRGR